MYAFRILFVFSAGAPDHYSFSAPVSLHRHLLTRSNECSPVFLGRSKSSKLYFAVEKEYMGRDQAPSRAVDPNTR